MDHNLDCKKSLAVVLPSLDPDDKFAGVVEGLIGGGFEHIVIVDDGSDEAHQHYFTAAEAHPQCTVLHHGVNRGKGRALKTAFSYIIDKYPQLMGAVTIDGDGQHLLEDIIRCGDTMLAQEDKVVLGCRDFDQPGVPKKNAAGNKSTSRLFRVLCGITLSDTQTGLRAIPAGCLEPFCRISGERFEYETNMLLQMKAQGISFVELPIATVYDPEDYSTHYNAVKDSLRILRVMAQYLFSQSPIRYVLSSAMSWVVDNLLYLAFFKAFLLLLSPSLVSPASHVAGRVFSSMVNFCMNYYWVFRRRGSFWPACGKYYCLCIPQTAVSVLLVSAAVNALGRFAPGTALCLKILIEAALFCLSYIIQKKWVFRSK